MEKEPAHAIAAKSIRNPLDDGFGKSLFQRVMRSLGFLIVLQRDIYFNITH